VRRNPADDDHPFDSPPDDSDQLLNGAGKSGTEAVDVREYEDTVSVVADIPNVDGDDIDIKCDGRALAVRISTDSRPVVLRVDLPTYVDDQSAETHYNNGVLEITLDQDYDPANIGFQ